MWSHWSYNKNSPAEYLEQGDVLQKSEQLKKLLMEYHPYYATHPDNQFYIVLTQTCDLRVRTNGDCKAQYIAIAPVRPLKTIIRKEFDAKLNKIDRGAPYASNRIKGEVERLLTRVFNNNEPSYFYLEAESAAGLCEPMCAVLALPISLKTEHYEVFLKSRIIGIEDSFQAKLGWLVGQHYSRVGTKDFDALLLKSKVDEVTDYMASWLDDNDVKVLRKLITEWKSSNPNALVDDTVIQSLVTKIPRKKQTAIQIILDIATSLGLAANPSTELGDFRKELDKDSKFALLFK